MTEDYPQPVPPLPPYVSPLVVLESVARSLSPDADVRKMVNAGLAAMVRYGWETKSQPAEEPEEAPPEPKPAPVQLTIIERDAIAALISLGCKRAEAEALMMRVKSAHPQLQECGPLLREMLKLRNSRASP